MRDAQGPKSWKFSLYCEHEKKDSVKTYDNDLTRTINSHEAWSFVFSWIWEFFFFQKDLCIKMDYLIAITRTYII